MLIKVLNNLNFEHPILTTTFSEAYLKHKLKKSSMKEVKNFWRQFLQ